MRESIVHIVDDDAIITKSMKNIVEGIGYRVITYSDPLEFLDTFSPKQSGCLVLDLRMPKMSGLELQEELANRQMTIPIIFISSHGDVPSVVRAMKGQAIDFLTKPVNTEVLIEAINKAIKRDLLDRDHHEHQREILSRVKRLTPRENEVMQLVVSGQSTKEIAKHLGISPNTVEIHRSKMMRKMAAKSVADLVNLAHQCMG